MEKLLTLLFTFGLWTVYILLGLIGAIIIQGLVYRLTGFSIYRKLEKIFLKILK
jgi:hypothetical protein